MQMAEKGAKSLLPHVHGGDRGLTPMQMAEEGGKSPLPHVMGES